MKRKIAIFSAVVMLMTLFTAPVRAELDQSGSKCTSNVTTYPLYAGQDELVGEVLIKSCDGQHGKGDHGGDGHTEDGLDESESCDGEHDEGQRCQGLIKVKFKITIDGWSIMETHVAMAESLSGIPQKNDNPIPGQFSQKETFSEGVTKTEWYCVDIENVLQTDEESVTEYYVAAHAVVERAVGTDEVPYGETAWGGEMTEEGLYNFNENNWARYIIYTYNPMSSH